MARTCRSSGIAYVERSAQSIACKSRTSTEAAGFVEVRQKGSHLILFNDVTGRRVTIPMHKGKDIKKPLLRKIIELEAQISITEFLKLL